jgi:hypothetical protein
MLMQEARDPVGLEPGMDVCDVLGEKFGRVSRVHHREVAVAGTSAVYADTTPSVDIIEVQTGLFGLGRRLYIPTGAVEDVVDGSIFVKAPKDRLDERGWGTKPGGLP